MIFAQYRDSVTEITEMLSRHRPVVKVMSFIGQSSTGKTSKGFTQKEQLKVGERRVGSKPQCVIDKTEIRETSTFNQSKI